MSLARILAEAATFTAGCAVLQSTRIDPKCVEIVLILTAAALTVAVLIELTPSGLGGDGVPLDPAGLWPRPR